MSNFYKKINVIENLEFVVQEKIDGSNFSITKNENIKLNLTTLEQDINKVENYSISYVIKKVKNGKEIQIPTKIIYLGKKGTKDGTL